MPPPTICIVRSGVMPGNATRCSGSMAASRGIQSSSCSRVMIHVSSRPDWRSTAPARRANERNVFDVPTACAGCLDLGNSSGGEERQAGLVRSRQHGHALADALFNLAQDLVAVGSLLDGRRGHREQLRDVVFLGKFHALIHGGQNRLDAGLLDRPVILDILHQPHRGFGAGLGIGSRAGRSVDDQHMNRVGADVKHAQSSDARTQIHHSISLYHRRGRSMRAVFHPRPAAVIGESSQ